MPLVTYLFRTTGQVIGVSIGGAVLQSVLLRSLREKITGPGAEEIIEAVRYDYPNTSLNEANTDIHKKRHSTSVISTLDPETQKYATAAYSKALHVVFICQAAINFCAFLSCLPIQENPLPSVLFFLVGCRTSC